jgi:hypothetical protein
MPIKGILGGNGVKPLGYGLGGAAEEATDPEFNQTVLLLHADGSEGEGNTSNLGNPNYKAFRDNSTSTHAIVVNGDAYGNDFSPYYYADGYWSVAFDGTDDILSVPNSSNHEFGTGQFTVELWVYMLDKSASSGQGFLGNYGDASNGWAVQIYGNNLEFAVKNGQIAQYDWSSRENNRWYHLAFARDGSNNMRAFIDGTQVVTGVKTDDITIGSNALQIGNMGPSLTRRFKGGYISNVRIVKGTALYTSTFTKPTAPLTTTSQSATASEVELLICQSNRFVDNSSNAFTVTLTSNPKISTNTPFTQSKTANVGSGFFDGNGDYLETATSSSLDFNANQFCIEWWEYRTARSSFDIVMHIGFNGSNSYGLLIGYTGNGIYWSSSGSSWDVLSNANFFGSETRYNNQWYHCVLTRDSSNQFRSFINGVLRYTTSVGSSGIYQAANAIAIGTGQNHTSNHDYAGYLSDINISNGSIPTRYQTSSTTVNTSIFTSPTAPTTSDTDTKLLTVQYSGAVRNVGFVDDSKYNHRITRNGDTTMGTFSPFSLEDGYWSVVFDDASDIQIAHSSEFNAGTGAFTLEGFVYLSSKTDFTTLYSQGYTNSGGILLQTSSGDSAFRLFLGSASPQFTLSAINLNEWVHIAIVRDGSGNLAGYINGVQDQTKTGVTGNLNNTSVVQIGEGGSDHELDGYISNLRFIKGTAKYQATSGASNFTVPTTPFTNESGTSFLVCQSNRFIDNSTTGHTLTTSGTPKVLPFSPFAPSRAYTKDAVGGSAYFDGTDDKLTIDYEGSIGAGDFTISAWVYRTSSGTFPVILDTRSANSDTKPVIYTDGSTLYYYTAGGTRITGSSAIKNNEWIFVRLVKESNVTKLFVNGTQVGSNYADTNDYAPTNDWEIGSRHTDEHYWPGYISNLQVVLTALDGTSVPTAPFTADANTVLLLNNNNAGIIDHTMKNNLETEDNTRISGQQVKFGTGSIYFDGTNDEIRMVPILLCNNLVTGFRKLDNRIFYVL